MSTGRITRIVGALAEAKPMRTAGLNDLVRVGDQGLLGEVLRVSNETATLQLFEETSGLTLDTEVTPTGTPLTAVLGPGLLGSVLDGIGRPLETIAGAGGDFILPGAVASTIDETKQWTFHATKQVGDAVRGGDIIGHVEERPGFLHHVMVPPDRAGVIETIASGECTVTDVVAALEDGSTIHLAERWPVRVPRPVATRLTPVRPFFTGQRVFDFLFPVAEGGTVAVPGGFGTGKTIIEQSLAKYASADVVVYVGCGERGNEMAEVIGDFSELVDPRTHRPVMDRTVLVVNTSNMPVAAREASVYLGLTIAEYYRDMGYRVAMMADSLSRWAEALREIGSRLQEMPGEEGYPTYLASRTARLHERAGYVRALGTPDRNGAVTLISAVSPPGGDFSEPVTQAALRVVETLWALDPTLAHQRQFPAVDWQVSYSLSERALGAWFASSVDSSWTANRAKSLEVLQREAELRDIAGLVGPEALEDEDRLLMEVATIVREVVIGQNAFDPNDASSPVEKTHRLAALTLSVHDAGGRALARGQSFAQLDLVKIRRALVAARDAPSEAFQTRLEEVAVLVDSLEADGRLEEEPS